MKRPQNRSISVFTRTLQNSDCPPFSLSTSVYTVSVASRTASLSGFPGRLCSLPAICRVVLDTDPQAAKRIGGGSAETWGYTLSRG